jgi:hypothetical protein
MKYVVNIREILEREVEIEADSLQKAQEKIEQQYNDEKIVLTADDYKGTEVIVRQMEKNREEIAEMKREQESREDDKQSCKFRTNVL